MSRPDKIKRYRSAITGRFVSAAYAKKHPRTTVAEHEQRVRTKTPKQK